MNSRLKKLLTDVSVGAVVDGQYGDNGKGKVVDILNESWAEISARGTGGANAGHTVCVKDKEPRVLHLLPCSTLHEHLISIIGRGVAFDPRIALQEMDELRQIGIGCENLMISRDARLVHPFHLLADRLKEAAAGDGKIGTTGRGMGPVYTDHAARKGFFVRDLLDLKLEAKFGRYYQGCENFLSQFSTRAIVEVMSHPHLGGGKYLDGKNINVEAICSDYLRYGEKLEPMITDTDSYLRSQVGEKNIVLEGAQGVGLGIDCGTYPYVTSSDPSVVGLASGVGLQVGDIDMTFGVFKAPYMTRVGEGPLPTELGGNESAIWCGRSDVNREVELERFGGDINVSSDPLAQGAAIRRIGNEYGATTGRPRRTGNLDLVQMRHGIIHSSGDLILTKMDVFDKAEQINVCFRYVYMGEERKLGGGEILRLGDGICDFPSDSSILYDCKPVYKTFDGWLTDITDIRSYDALPENLKVIIDFIEEETYATTCMISVGPDRDQIIFV